MRKQIAPSVETMKVHQQEQSCHSRLPISFQAAYTGILQRVHIVVEPPGDWSTRIPPSPDVSRTKEPDRPVHIRGSPSSKSSLLMALPQHADWTPGAFKSCVANFKAHRDTAAAKSQSPKSASKRTGSFSVSARVPRYIQINEREVVCGWCWPGGIGL